MFVSSDGLAKELGEAFKIFLIKNASLLVKPARWAFHDGVFNMEVLQCYPYRNSSCIANMT